LERSNGTLGQCSAIGETHNHLKLQTPNSKEAPSSKFQARSEGRGLELGAWDLFGVWSLVFGVSTARLPTHARASKPALGYRANICRMMSSMGTSWMSMSVTGSSSNSALQTAITRSRLTLSL